MLLNPHDIYINVAAVLTLTAQVISVGPKGKSYLSVASPSQGVSQDLNIHLQAEELLTRQRLTHQQVKDRYARTKMENVDLKEKIGLIERLDVLAFRRESACLVEYQQLHLKETY